MANPIPIDASYRRQVDLLLRLLPQVAAEACFALKGGTAINLFDRDMPRLSVDLDLTYLPVAGREVSLAGTGDALGHVAAAAGRALPGVRVTRQGGAKLVATEAGTVVKVEVNTVIRGTLLPVRDLDLCGAAQNAFGRFVTARVVAEGELFGGKLVAALDRQHPPPARPVRRAVHPRPDRRRAGRRPPADFLLMLLGHDSPPQVVGARCRTRAGTTCPTPSPASSPEWPASRLTSTTTGGRRRAGRGRAVRGSRRPSRRGGPAGGAVEGREPPPAAGARPGQARGSGRRAGGGARPALSRGGGKFEAATDA